MKLPQFLNKKAAKYEQPRLIIQKLMGWLKESKKSFKIFLWVSWQLKIREQKLEKMKMVKINKIKINKITWKTIRKKLVLQKHLLPRFVNRKWKYILRVKTHLTIFLSETKCLNMKENRTLCRNSYLANKETECFRTLKSIKNLIKFMIQSSNLFKKHHKKFW